MTMHPEVRSTLEEVYERVRDAVRRRDFEAFSALVEPAHPESAFTRESFEKSACVLKEAYPDLKKLRFYKAEATSDWAGYYSTRDVGDPHFSCLVIFRFHRCGMQWKLCDKVNFSMLPKGTATTRVLKELSSNPHYRLPGQDGYDEG